MQVKSINRQQNDKIKDLTNQINELNSTNLEIKSKYERQLRSNLDLKKQQEKISVNNKKIDKNDSDKVKSLEFELDQTLIALDSLKED